MADRILGQTESLVRQTEHPERPVRLLHRSKKSIQKSRNIRDWRSENFLSSFLGNADFFDNWKSIVGGFGVCAFSRENQNTLLWSHYVDHHKGACLKCQFRGSYFLKEEFDLTAAGNVEYLDEPQTEWLVNAPLDITNFVTELVHKYPRQKAWLGSMNRKRESSDPNMAFSTSVSHS